MNDQYKIDWEARIQGFNHEFDNSYSQPNPENVENWVQQQQQSTFVKNKPSSTIMSRFETPTSAFYATERCMGFSHYDSQNGDFSTNNNNNNNNYNPCLSSQFYSSFSDSSLDHQTQPNFDIRPNNIDPFISHVNTTPSLTRQFSLNSKENHNIGGYGGCFSRMSFDSSSHNQNKQSLKLLASATKTRIRWTQDLHEKFVECVNRLGGSEKATPKGILRLMESDGLTIFHVKSHLQKYRIAKYLPDSSEGKCDKRACIDVTPQLEVTTGLQIKEALHLQLDVQRRLHEQLEIQRKLQLQIEEQGKQLKMMFDMQQRRSDSLLKSQSSDISSVEEEAPSNDIDDHTSGSFLPT